MERLNKDLLIYLTKFLTNQSLAKVLISCKRIYSYYFSILEERYKKDFLLIKAKYYEIKSNEIMKIRNMKKGDIITIIDWEDVYLSNNTSFICDIDKVIRTNNRIEFFKSIPFYSPIEFPPNYWSNYYNYPNYYIRFNILMFRDQIIKNFDLINTEDLNIFEGHKTFMTLYSKFVYKNIEYIILFYELTNTNISLEKKRERFLKWIELSEDKIRNPIGSRLIINSEIIDRLYLDPCSI